MPGLLRGWGGVSAEDGGYADHRGLGLTGKRVVIGDGAAWIDGFAEMYGPKRVRIVDGYHAVEHL